MAEINFGELKDPQKFERFMNQLLNLKFGAEAVRPPYDRGRDSYVIDDNGNLIIFQYKFFQIAMNSAQRRELEDSLKTALENYSNLYLWKPCFPREFTSGEEDFLKKLSEKYNIKISRVGAAQIKNWVHETNFPLDQYFDSQMYKKTDRKINEMQDRLRRGKEIRFETINKVIKDIIKMEQEGEYEIKTELPDDIKEKIIKNKLSDTFEEVLRMQMTKFSQIDSYLESGLLKRQEIDNLLFSLKMTYLKFKNRYDNGDDIFMAMIDHILPSGIDDEHYQAYCALLCYFFHTCEVFEKC